MNNKDSFFEKYCHPDDETLAELDMAIKSANYTKERQSEAAEKIKNKKYIEIDSDLKEEQDKQEKANFEKTLAELKEIYPNCEIKLSKNGKGAIIGKAIIPENNDEAIIKAFWDKIERRGQ